MDRVGGPVGCSTVRIGSWKLLGLLEFAPQGLPACNDVCKCSGHLSLNWAASIQLESSVSGMTRVSKLQTELVVGGVMIRLATRQRRQCSKWNQGYGIHKSRGLCW